MNPFKSFWWAGYECSDKLNAFGNRVDLLSETKHIELADEDYKHLIPYHIHTVREGIRWSQVEKQPYKYDWSPVAKLIHAGKANNIQQVWDMCHFGFPDDLTPLHPMFARRFAALCKAFVQFYRTLQPKETLIVTPINEVSFLSWLGGDARGTSPYCIHQGWEVKYHLMRAYIEAVAAILETDPSVRILTTEPLTNPFAPSFATEEQVRRANEVNEFQFQCLDILGGIVCPELGGRREYLDILGYNFYHNNQWQYDTFEMLSWEERTLDNRWKPLSIMLTEAFERYDRPIALTETSYCGMYKPEWLEYVASECAAVIEQNIPLWGICWYPIIDRPDWDQLHIWHDAGLWNIDPSDATMIRKLHKPTAEMLHTWQRIIQEVQVKEFV